MVGNKGGRGVVGNKGGRGVVGNKGNTTAGQSKVKAAEKRKSFKGNVETGHSKRSAGKRSGLIRRAKQALVAQKRWLDEILDGEKLRGAGKAMQFSTEQEGEHQALQRSDGGAFQLAVVAHAGEANLQRVLKTEELLQQVRDLDLYLMEFKCVIVEVHPARMPRRLAPPLLVLAPLQAARAADNKGRHAPGRISVVCMAIIRTLEYQTPVWIGHNLDRLCREQVVSGVVPRRKKTAGGTTLVPSRSRQKQKCVGSGSRDM